MKNISEKFNFPRFYRIIIENSKSKKNGSNIEKRSLDW
jgi:ribosomal protein S16